MKLDESNVNKSSQKAYNTIDRVLTGDSQANIETAERLGFSGVCSQNYERAVEKLDYKMKTVLYGDVT